MKAKNLVGHRFERLLVQHQVGVDKHGNALWECLCNCGTLKIVAACHLGKTKSCGCLQQEHCQQMGLSNLSHGHSTGGKLTSEYRAWSGLLQRCFNLTCPGYPDYGGRGIKVCNRWNPNTSGSFQNFLNDMGLKPDKDFSIDRRNVDGDYEPNNCRWATKSVQSHNQRKFVAVPVKLWEAIQDAVLNDLSFLLPFRQSILKNKHVKGTL
jgi:hypothetical protein